MAKPRVLIVEDSATVRERLARTFLAAGCEVDACAESATALEHARSDTPSLILQDLLLPDMAGFELGRRFRAIPECAETPMIAFSAYQDLLDEAHDSEVHYVEYLLKPVDPEKLLEAARHHVDF